MHRQRDRQTDRNIDKQRDKDVQPIFDAIEIKMPLS